MGLSSSLQIGRTALTASQLAIQVTGNNFANASTPGYSRQVVDLAAFPDSQYGRFQVGRGVDIIGIRRQTDSALQNRLWSGYSREGAANVDRQVLSNIESTLNELGDNDLSTQINQFFSAWSELANSPNRDGARSLVVSEGRSLASSIRSLRSNLLGLADQAKGQLNASVERANALFQQIADINVQIVAAEGGQGGANALRDQRDQLITQLSSLLDVTVVEQPSGGVNVLVGSTPVVIEGINRGVEVQRVLSNGDEVITVNVKADSMELRPSGGSISALLGQLDGPASSVLDKLDEVSAQLIFELNKLHSVGSGSVKLTSVRGTLPIQLADQTRAFNDPANTALSALPFKPVNGGFLVTVTNASTGASQTVRVRVDLDGITNAGAPGTSNDTSVTSLATDLDAIPNLNASVQPDGTLQIDAATGYNVSFGDDTSGVLAVLGVNTFFTGAGAGDIAVRDALISTPGLLATGSIGANGQPIANGTALAIAQLKDKSLGALGGTSILGAWRDKVQEIGSQTTAAKTQSEAAKSVRENLESQRAAVSGVDLDEESINLLNYQRMYQGAARFITVVDELTQTLLGLIN